MSDENKLHSYSGDKAVRTHAYYDQLLKRFCGPEYHSLLRVHKRSEVREFLRSHKTALVSGIPQDINCFRAEVFNIIVHNHLTAVRTNDTELVKLNFHELGELPDTTIENSVELVRPDFLWIDICTTKNSFIPHQIMLVINMRMEQGKRTIIYSPTSDDKAWTKLYESDVFNKFLNGFKSSNDPHYLEVKDYK